MKSLLIVGLGGGIGSMCRYLVQVFTNRYIPIAFPLGTFLVNLTGCFIIGLLYGLSNKYAWMTFEWRLFLVTGLCGGFTTFSSYSFESIGLLRQGNYAYFILFIVLSVAFGLLATLAGAALAK